MTNKLTASVITIQETEELFAAINEFKLRQLEIERAQKAAKEAEDALDAVIAESLKHIPLKWMEGELVKVSDYNRLYCYFDNEFTRIPISCIKETI